MNARRMMPPPIRVSTIASPSLVTLSIPIRPFARRMRPSSIHIPIVALPSIATTYLADCLATEGMRPPPIRITSVTSSSIVTCFSLAQSRLEGEFCRDVPEGILVVQLLADQHVTVAHSAAQFGVCVGHCPSLCCFGDGLSLSRPQPSVC